MGQPEVAKPNREPKHMSIYHAMSQLKEARHHLDNLFDAVGGHEDPSDKASEASHDPTLVHILDTAGQQIVSIADGINVRINELRELIL